MTQQQQQPSSSFMNYPPTASDFCFRKIMKQSTAAICKMHGFDFIQPRSLELLTQMMTCYLVEACRSSKTLSEHGGRTIVNPTDAFLALADMGTDMESFNEFLFKLRSTGSLIIPQPRIQTQPQHSNLLKIGERKPLPPHIPSFLPPFPDPHTYIRTKVSGEPDTTYEKTRILTANNKRNNEASLLRYMLSIYPTVSLYRDYENRLKEEAKLKIKQEKMQKQLRLEALKAARERQTLKKALERIQGDSVPENILEDPINQKKTDSTDEDEKLLKEMEIEEMFSTKETENSLVRKRLPYHTSVFVPFTNKKPYLVALLSDDLLDEEKSQEASTSKLSDMDETIGFFVDNPYLQAPRIADVSGTSPNTVQEFDQQDQASELEDMPLF